MRIAAILLAAGEGRRMGGPKALLAAHGTTFLAHLCRVFDAAGADLAIAVLGAEAERVRRHAGIPDGVVVVVNDRWRDGMLGSIWCGLAAAEAQAADAVLVHPVDNPVVAPATVAAVVSEMRQGGTVVVPVHGGRRGHPAGFGRRAWPALRAASPQRGARQVLLDHPQWVRHLDAGADCLVDLDTPGDLRAL